MTRRPDVIATPARGDTLRISGPRAHELDGMLLDLRHTRTGTVLPAAAIGDLRAACQHLRLWLIEAGGRR